MNPTVRAKPDRTVKIPTVSGGSLPLAALLFLSYGLRVAVEALPKSPRPVPVRQFAPSWAVCKNSPFSPTAAPYPVTVHLSPTRKDT